ncbi:MAG TPA: hypothetical protein VEK07_01765 [Polyangiaceae bacterium]|nr:hypothetical protein [Polyangiaceae bacterium]
MAGLSLLGLAACTTSNAAPVTTTPEAGCEPYVSDADLSESVSFSANVVPVFMTNCAVGGNIGCHSAGNASPFLGSSDGGVDASIVLASIIGVEAGEDPEMDYVAPNEPEQSYLMHKMDGDQCTLQAQCALSFYNEYYPNCGASMPFLPHLLLPAPVRDQVRAWISQGAQNN